MVDLLINRNCRYQTAYPVIWCPKDRRDALTGPIAAEVGTLLEGICCERGWPVISKQIQPDQRLWGGHLWSPSYYVGTAGTISATTIQRFIERAEQVTQRR